MTAPNIVSVATITGKTAVANLTTSAANVITNSAGSNSVIKVNNIMMSNYTAGSLTGNIYLNRSGTQSVLAGTVTVPGYSLLTIIGKDTSFYMEEGDVLQANSSANSSISITTSYEIIS